MLKGACYCYYYLLLHLIKLLLLIFSIFNFIKFKSRNRKFVNKNVIKLNKISFLVNTVYVRNNFLTIFFIPSK